MVVLRRAKAVGLGPLWVIKYTFTSRKSLNICTWSSAPYTVTEKLLYIIKGPMKVISGFLLETWGYFCMKNFIFTTRNCHSHIHESTHFILLAFLKLHPHCFPRLASGPLMSRAVGRPPPADHPSQWACPHVECIILVNREVVSNTVSLTPPLFIDMSVPNQDSERSCICILEVSTLSLSVIFYWLVDSWCSTQRLIIFQLYRGGYFYSIGFWNCCDSLVLFWLYIFNLSATLEPTAWAPRTVTCTIDIYIWW
jgi:hypothetical protein